MKSPFSLSKSTFMYGCQCPKRLYLHKYHKALANPVDEGQEALMDTGTHAGLLARELFPGGKDASPPDAFQYAQAARDTQIYLATHQVIYEATFIHNGIMCAVDILVKRGKAWHAFEVKATNSVKPQHITDAALQYAVITGSGLPLADISIVHLNKNYTRIGDIDVQQLFTMQSVLEEVLQEQEFIHTQAESQLKLLQQKNIPDIIPGEQCDKPYTCNFTNYCYSQYPELIEEEEPATDTTVHVDREAVQEYLNQLQYPLYFFDFETVRYAVPHYQYTKPWQQVPFQYSLHMLPTPDAPLQHSAFLGDGHTDPREALLQQLLNDIGTQGTILSYFVPFERTRLKELAEFAPHHAAAIDQLLPRMLDLMTPFQKGWIQHPLAATNSIKDVLPALIPELSYTNLHIQDGGMASYRYATIPQLPPSEAEQVRGHLLEYCALDTMAMVKIYEWMRSATSHSFKSENL